MRNSFICRLLSQKRSRTFHSIAKRSAPLVDANQGQFQETQCPNWRAAFKEKLASEVYEKRNDACIYKVPINMRDVEPKAYRPNIISIGPYHHGEERLQEMEEFKRRFVHRLFYPTRPNGVQLDSVISALEELEQKARICYWDNVEHNSERFVKMMLLDGCFIVELFRELKLHNFKSAPSIERWMLPTLRRDLIMLENQLPLFVLQKLFKLINGKEDSSTSIQELALRFFNPLLQRDSDPAEQSIPGPQGDKRPEHKHFLDLFRSSILPRHSPPQHEADSQRHSNKQVETTIEKGPEIHMIRSITELKEAGIIIEKGKNCPPLDVRSEGRVLKIPPLYIDDYKGTLFRNMVAFEQCHRYCGPPDVTSYLFFFDGLINCAEDVGLLHHKEVLHHSLGNNKEVAKLVNSLCKEISLGAEKPYLHLVIDDANYYIGSYYAKIRAKLVHHYFSSWVVGVSTIAAALALYLTLIQTGCGIPDAIKATSEGKTSFRSYLLHSLLLPFYGGSSSTNTETNPKNGS